MFAAKNLFLAESPLIFLFFPPSPRRPFEKLDLDGCFFPSDTGMEKLSNQTLIKQPEIRTDSESA